MYRMIAVGWMLLALGISSACQPTTTTSAPPLRGSAVSTPVENLPVSIITEATRQQATRVPDSIIQEADADYMLLANIYERTTPAVVNVEATLPDAAGNEDLSRGSGFVYDRGGHIVTNAHVVNGANAIRVTFDDGYVTDADLIGVDTYSDLAVIRVNLPTERLFPLQLTPDSNTVRVGQRAVAIGNPFGLNSSLATGVVSGIGRTLHSAELIDSEALPGFQNPSIIQTDTPINPGNSGGPLLNSLGEVVGVTTAIRSQSGVFQGVGFAVPANTVRRVIPELISMGSVDYAWLGVSITPEDNGFGVAGLAEPLNLPVSKGVLVRGVTVGSPADEAGLRGGNSIVQVRGQPICTGGDIIVAVNGIYVETMAQLATYFVVNSSPGDTVTLLIIRDRSTFELPLTLAARPSDESRVRDCEG